MIKNIIFDFGGVLLDLDTSKTDEKFKELFQLEFEERNYPKSFWDIFLAYEKGLFSEGSFLHRLQRLSDTPITERNLIAAWNAMLGPLPDHRLKLLTELRKKYNLFLLSNTNHTHIQFVYDYLLKSYRIEDFGKEYFDKAYLSYKIQMCKPNHDIYNYVVNDSGIRAEESLFVDDSILNVHAAKDVGLKSVVHDPGIDISEVIDLYIRQA